jgi:MFS family permease
LTGTPQPPPVDQPAPGRQLRASRNAVFAVFFLNGLVTATWLSRIPAVRSTLGLSPGQLGLLLLGPAAGSVLSLPLAGQVVRRLGARRTIRVFAIVCNGGVALAGVGVSTRLVSLTLVGLFCFGLGTGTYDVAMNVEGAAVEQLLRRSIMPRFHAGWSCGTVVGALLGAAAASLGLPVVVHFAIITGLGVLLTQLVCRWLLTVDPHDEGPPLPPRAALRAWTERRTVLIGVVTLCAALAEGVANEWFGQSLIYGYHQSQSVGAIGLWVFVTAMTFTRAFGTSLIDRLGRVLALRLAALITAVGIGLVVVGPWVGVALLGGVLWGAGAALGFPMGMSAAADDPAWSAPRVGVVASIGYVAFLAGPPLVGFVADGVGVRRAVAVVLVALVVMAALAPVERELARDPARDPATPDTAATPGAPSGSGDGAFTS